MISKDDDALSIRRIVWQASLDQLSKGNRSGLTEYVFALLRLSTPAQWRESEGPLIPYDREQIAFMTGNSEEDVSAAMKELHEMEVVIAKKTDDGVVIDLSPLRG